MEPRKEIDLDAFQARFMLAITSPSEWEAYDWEDISSLIREVRILRRERAEESVAKIKYAGKLEAIKEICS